MSYIWPAEVDTVKPIPSVLRSPLKIINVRDFVLCCRGPQGPRSEYLLRKSNVFPFAVPLTRLRLGDP